MGMIELPRWYHPQLGQKGKKPTGGPYKIRKKHWSTEGLDFYTPFIGGNRFDITRDRAGILQVDSDFRVEDGKEVLFCTNGGTFSGVHYDDDPGFDHTQPFTIAVKFRLDASTIRFPTLIDFTTTTATDPWRLLASDFPTSGDFRGMAFGHPDDANIIHVPSIDFDADLEGGPPHVAIIVFHGGSRIASNHDFYLDGVLQTLAISGSFSAAPNTTVVGGRSDSSVNGWGGSVEYCARWPNVEWNEEQARKFTEDPYMLLEPVFPMQYFTAEAAAGFQAAWARRQSQIIGAGVR